MRSVARLIHAADGQPLAISIFHDLTDRMRAEWRQQFLNKCGAHLQASLDEDEIVAELTQLPVESMADWAATSLVDPTGGIRRTAIAVSGHDGSRLAVAEALQQQYPPERTDSSPLFRTLTEGQGRLVPPLDDGDLAIYARDPEHLRLLRELNLAEGLYAPLIARDRTLGVFGMFATGASGRHYDQDDLALVEEVARRVALSIDNARLYRDAQEAVQARDEFLSIAAHELRTPLTAIKGTAQQERRLHERGSLDLERAVEAFDRIVESADRLGSLLGDLLDVSGLRLGQLELTRELVDLRALAASVADRQRVTLKEGQTITLVPSSRAVTVWADGSRLEQVVSNLLDNAIKYSPAGGRVTIELSEQHDGAVISVRDQGIGLPADAAATIFKPFGRATNARSAGAAGMGLGLFICQQIVERHGGWIRAESPGEGLGMSVSVWIPSRPSAQSIEVLVWREPLGRGVRPQANHCITDTVATSVYERVCNGGLRCRPSAQGDPLAASGPKSAPPIQNPGSRPWPTRNACSSSRTRSTYVRFLQSPCPWKGFRNRAASRPVSYWLKPSAKTVAQMLGVAQRQHGGTPDADVIAAHQLIVEGVTPIHRGTHLLRRLD